MFKIGEMTRLALCLLCLIGGAKADPLHLVMVGPPGAGKGTQAKQLSEHFQIPHISTGAMLREHIGRETELGLSAKRYVDSGELVPNEIIVAMLEQRLAEEKGGFILDGFPRSVEQAEILDNIMSSLSCKIDAAVCIQVPAEVVIERLVKRGREDDTPEIIRRRLEIYDEETAPVIDFYDKSRRLLKVDGTGSIEEVHNRIIGAVEQSTKR